MSSFNKVMLMGNLTRDIELRYTPAGKAVGAFGIAVNRKFRDSKTNETREEVTFVDCEVWDKTAENMSQHLSKGKPVFIEGRLKLDQWNDKTSGEKRSKLKVVVDTFQFIGGPKPEGEQSPVTKPTASRPAPEAFDNLDINEQDIPF